jgi:hypothetical protein
LTILGTPQAASVRARITGRYFMEVCLVLGEGKVNASTTENRQKREFPSDCNATAACLSANAETRMQFQRVILAEYEKVVAGRETDVECLSMS